MDEEKEGCRERMRDVSHQGECLCMLSERKCVTGKHIRVHRKMDNINISLSPQSTVYSQCTHLLTQTHAHMFVLVKCTCVVHTLGFLNDQEYTFCCQRL